MILEGLKYSQHAGEAREWNLVGNNNDYAYFSNINLLVGRNASGKSRTLNVIKEIANLLSGRIALREVKCSNQKFDLLFENKGNNNGEAQGTKYNYVLEIKDRKVAYEQLMIDQKECFSREYEKINVSKGSPLFVIKEKLEIEDSKLLICTKATDNIASYPNFINWGESLKNYLFADQFEKRLLIEDMAAMEEPEKNKEITGALLLTFYLGKKSFGEEFVAELIQSMHDLGYDEVSGIDIHKSEGGYSIGVEENKRYVVSQRQMSQGMFRALSLFVFLIYAKMKKVSACVLIDDIGEGVDFDKSKLLTQLMIRKLHNSSIQCFMSTNDRYVMNDIPLRFWVVIDREVKKSILYDTKNSKETFEDFQFTGLNNYEFLTTNFYKDGFGEDEEDEENK